MRRQGFRSKKFEEKVEENERKKESENESLKKINKNLLNFCVDMVDAELENIFLRHSNEMMMIFIDMTSSFTQIEDQCEMFYNLIRKKIHENVELEKMLAKADEVKFIFENQLEQNDFLEKGRLFDAMSIYTDSLQIKYSKCENALRERVNQSGEITITSNSGPSTSLSLRKDSKMYDWDSVFRKYDKFIEEHLRSAAKLKSEFDATVLQDYSWIEYKYLIAENQRLTGKVDELEERISEIKFKFNLNSFDSQEPKPEPKPEPKLDNQTEEFLRKVYSETSKFKFRSLLNNNLEKVSLIDCNQINGDLRQTFNDFLKKIKLET